MLATSLEADVTRIPCIRLMQPGLWLLNVLLRILHAVLHDMGICRTKGAEGQCCSFFHLEKNIACQEVPWLTTIENCRPSVWLFSKIGVGHCYDTCLLPLEVPRPCNADCIGWTRASTGRVMLAGTGGSQKAAGGPHEPRDGDPESSGPAVSLLSFPSEHHKASEWLPRQLLLYQIQASPSMGAQVAPRSDVHLNL